MYYSPSADQYLPMSVLKDNSVIGGTLNMTLKTGNLKLTSGVFGQALELDGQSTVMMGDSRSSCFWNPERCPDGLTISLFFKQVLANAHDTNSYILSNGGQTLRSFGLAFFVTSHKKVKVTVTTRTTRHSYISNTTIDVGIWFHLVVVWKEEEKLMVCCAIL